MRFPLFIFSIPLIFNTINGQILNGDFEDGLNSDLSNWEWSCFAEPDSSTLPGGEDWSIKVWGGGYSRMFPRTCLSNNSVYYKWTNISADGMGVCSSISSCRPLFRQNKQWWYYAYSWWHDLINFMDITGYSINFPSWIRWHSNCVAKWWPCRWPTSRLWLFWLDKSPTSDWNKFYRSKSIFETVSESIQQSNYYTNRSICP